MRLAPKVSKLVRVVNDSHHSKLVHVVNDSHHSTFFSALQKCNRKNVCTII